MGCAFPLLLLEILIKAGLIRLIREMSILLVFQVSKFDSCCCFLEGRDLCFRLPFDELANAPKEKPLLPVFTMRESVFAVSK
jgi:hypothetical protein